MTREAGESTSGVKEREASARRAEKPGASRARLIFLPFTSRDGRRFSSTLQQRVRIVLIQISSDTRNDERSRRRIKILHRRGKAKHERERPFSTDVDLPFLPCC